MRITEIFNPASIAYVWNDAASNRIPYLGEGLFPAMQKAAQCILEHHRAKECDDLCMPIKDIINLIPEE